MRIAVIGGGLFGSTAAIYAARAGYDVDLFEAKNDLMQGATASTYCRVHRGAHYPRHAQTGRESRFAEKSFRAEYGPAIIDKGSQFYVVPEVPENHVTIKQFAQFLDSEGLYFSEEVGVFKVQEPRVNLGILSDLVRDKVAEAGIKVHYGAKADASLLDEYDQIIVATYANLNDVLVELGCEPDSYRFQVVEKPIIRLPSLFRNVSIVVVDGPFGCIDPYEDTEYHALGHVTKTIHASNTGTKAIVPPHLAPFINEGFIPDAPHSNWLEASADLSQYIPGMNVEQYLGSSYVVRAVLAHKEATDERPSVVRRHSSQVWSIFSGKLGTACHAAQEVVASIGTNQAILAA